MNDTLRDIEIWHERARPFINSDDIGIQLGCHMEEVAEMLRALEQTIAVSDAVRAVEHLAELWKSGNHYPMIADRRELLDARADQVVTAVGVGHCAQMNVPEACSAVNFSNWSKFDSEGQPIFTPQGKVSKGPNYAPPSLNGLF